MKTISKALAPFILLLTIAQMPNSANATVKYSSTFSFVLPNPLLKAALKIAYQMAIKSKTWVRNNIENAGDQALYMLKINNIVNKNSGRPSVIVEKVKTLFVDEIRVKYPAKTAQINSFVKNVLDPALQEIQRLGH